MKRVFFFLFFFLNHCLFASLDDAVDKCLKGRNFSGVILIAQDGKTLVHKGQATDAPFLIGSIAKQITSACILQAVELGAVNLDSHVLEFLPEYCHSEITVHQLLNHTSPSEFPYSHASYDVLGQILEKIHQRSFQDIAKKLFAQIGMKNTQGLSITNASSGAITSTAQDLQRWHQTLHHGLLREDLYQTILSSGACHEHRYGMLNYGYGLQVCKDDELLEISHEGLVQDHLSTLIYYPEYKCSVVILEKKTVQNQDNNELFLVHDNIRQAVRLELCSQPLSSCLWGAYVLDVVNGDCVFSHNAQALFIPASVTKLFTTAASLEILGDSFVFDTKVYADAIIDGDVQGNLYLEGSYDPTLMSEDLKRLALDVYNKGIRLIHGKVLVDGRSLLPKHMEWEDLVTDYAQEQCALNVNENVIKLNVVPNPFGKGPATVHVEDEVNYCHVTCDVMTVANLEKPQLVFSRSLSDNHFHVSGLIGLFPVSEKVSVHKPSEYARRLFVRYLESNGIQILKDQIDESISVEIAKHESQPLSEIVGLMNYRSHNLTADLVYQRMKSEGRNEPFSQIMNDLGNYALHDGSGLSRHNLVSPMQTVNLLSRFAKNEIFMKSLPMIDLQVTDNHNVTIYAKSGSMSGITNLAGFIDLPGQNRRVFALFINNSLMSRKEQLRVLHSQLLKINF